MPVLMSHSKSIHNRFNPTLILFASHASYGYIIHSWLSTILRYHESATARPNPKLNDPLLLHQFKAPQNLDPSPSWWPLPPLLNYQCPSPFLQVYPAILTTTILLRASKTPQFIRKLWGHRGHSTKPGIDTLHWIVSPHKTQWLKLIRAKYKLASKITQPISNIETCQLQHSASH